MNHDDLRDWSKRAADWAHGYHAGLRDRPVRAPLTPWSVADQLPPAAPEAAELVVRLVLFLVDEVLREEPGGRDLSAFRPVSPGRRSTRRRHPIVADWLRPTV